MIALLLLLAAGTVHAASEEFLLVADRENGGVYKVNTTSGARTRLPLQNSIRARTVAYDPVTSHVMWYSYRDVLAAKLDGSNYTVAMNVSKSVAHMTFDAMTKTLYFNHNGDLTSQVLGGNRTSKIATGINPNTQLSFHSRSSVLYFFRNEVAFQVQADGSSLRELFSQHGHLNMRGIAVSPAGDTLYTCGYNSKGSYYYKYSILTNKLTSLGSRKGHVCFRLATDGLRLYILETASGRIVVMPVNSHPASATVLATDFKFKSVIDMKLISPLSDTVDDCASTPCLNGAGCVDGLFSYTCRCSPGFLGSTCQTDCRMQPQFTVAGPVSLSLPDNIQQGEVFTSLTKRGEGQCRLAGDTGTTTTFTVTTSNTSCSLALTPGHVLEAGQEYNMTVLLYRSCDGQVMDRKEVMLRVENTCQAVLESARPGDVALEIQLSYLGQARPLAVQLRGDNRGQHNHFTIRTGQLRALGNNTASSVAQVIVNKPLDHESGLLRHRLTLELDYCVRVLDTNDNAPVFRYPNASYGSSFISVKENFTGNLIQAQASDADSGRFGNAGLRYTILSDPEKHFSVDERTGNITITRPLDREASPLVIVMIEVKDNEGVPPFNKAHAALQVWIEDVNDNTPVFAKASYKMAILEVVPVGYKVLTVLATDQDESVNSDLSFTLSSVNQTNPFRINSNTGAILVQQKLWGRAGTYLLAATARDGGTPALSSSVPVTIEVRAITAFPGRRRRHA